MNVSDIGSSLSWDKSKLTKMIEKLGMDETVERFSWLHSASRDATSRSINQFLNDDFVDDEGKVGGHCFYGDL